MALDKIVKFIPVLLVCFLTSCTYFKYSAIQAEYTSLQSSDPSQINLKHMLNQDLFFIWGKPKVELDDLSNLPMAIVAYTSQFKEHERVDSMFFKGTNSHYGLTLPEGNYILLVYADKNRDQMFDQSEVVGVKNLELNTTLYPEKLAKNIDVDLVANTSVSWAKPIPSPEIAELEPSLYYPSGAIRTLNDPIFDEDIATMGMYDPASFLELSPTMFYALEEDVAHKIPVIFVHGIGGNSQSFEKIVEHMDKERYQAWFFYYPSGGDLDQLAGLFYNIFLSGSVISKGNMPMIVVAHSMGGLVVRDALNRYQGSEEENNIQLFVSIATPFAGHPSAALGVEHGLLVLPAWRDLNPSSQFIQQLYRTTLPESVNHQLFYAYNNSDVLKMGENSDGVVPLSSQLYLEAQKQSRRQLGFNSDHINVLENEAMLEHLLDKMASVENIFPDSHMRALKEGGFELRISDGYSPKSKHIIGYAGKYLVLLAKGELKPINQQQERFVLAVQEKIPATSEIEKEFLRFMRACESEWYNCQL